MDDSSRVDNNFQKNRMNQVGTALSILDFPIICRVCLARADVKPLQQFLSELFYKITSIKLDPNGNLPHNICDDCIRHLQNIWDFIEMSKTSEANLQNIFEKQADQTSHTSDTQEFSDSGSESNKWDTSLEKEVMSHEQSSKNIKNEIDCHIEFKSGLHFKEEETDRYGEHEKTYECNPSDTKCSNPLTLNVHLQTHSDTNPHVCTICGKTFKFISNLIRHNKDIHKKVKPFQCEICSKEFPTFSSRKQHDCRISQSKTAENIEKSKQDNKDHAHKCSICRKSFKLLRFYQQHVKKHKNPVNEMYECEICCETFSRKTSLESHMRKHIEEGSFDSEVDINEKHDTRGLTCEFCDKQFRTKKTLYDHMPAHTKQFQCEFCDKVCTKRFHLENHRKLHTGEKPFKCEFCDKTFRLKSARKAHLRVHTGERPYQCKLCEKSFAQKSNVIDHERRHTGDTPYSCRFCSKWFIQKSHLKRHESEHTGGKASQTDEDNKIENTVEIDHAKGLSGEDNIDESENIGDESGFARLERKTRHVKIHSMKSTESNVLYSCKKCDETFTRKTEYRSHMTQHGESQDISETKCRICNKVFSSKYNMQSHMVIHNETRDFLCNICGKGFSKKVYLDTHSLIHSGEKPYQCKECGKSFRQRSTYNRHVLVHTDERSFQCDQCEKTFQQKTHLTRHRMVHTGEKRFECGYCGKKFGQNVNLKAHVRTHTGETAYHCAVCGRGFYDSSSMKKHMKGHARDGSGLPSRDY